MDYHIEFNGLFTAKDITKGTILCIKRGIFLTTNFLNYSDYNCSNITYIRNTDGVHLLDNNFILTYADYCRDPLDMDLVNTELIENSNEFVELIATKDIKAGTELCQALGKYFWAAYYRSKWGDDKASMPDLIRMRRAKQVYEIDDAFLTNISDQYIDSNNILKKIKEFEFWSPETVHIPNNLINHQASCYMAAVLQCLAHIPALTRIFTETNLLDNSLLTNGASVFFIHKYRELLEVLASSSQKDREEILTKQSSIYQSRNLIHPTFILGVQNDADEFIIHLFDKFCREKANFEYVIHHLFGFYQDMIREVDICNHTYTRRSFHISMQLDFINPKEYAKAEHLETLFDNYFRLIHEIGYHCAECKKPKSETDTTTYTTQSTINKYPRILYIQLKRFKFTNTAVFLRKPIIYKRYITIKEGKHFAVRYELISVVVFKGYSLSRGHYFSYVLNSDDKWYKFDDLEKEAVQVTAYEALNQDLAYLFFYKKCDHNRHTAIEKQKFDMLVDSYGKDNLNMVAISLNLPYDSQKKIPFDDTETFINRFQRCPPASFESFQEYLKDKKINGKSIEFNFFRHFEKGYKGDKKKKKKLRIQ